MKRCKAVWLVLLFCAVMATGPGPFSACAQQRDEEQAHAREKALAALQRISEIERGKTAESVYDSTRALLWLGKERQALEQLKELKNFRNFFEQAIITFVKNSSQEMGYRALELLDSPRDHTGSHEYTRHEFLKTLIHRGNYDLEAIRKWIDNRASVQEQDDYLNHVVVMYCNRTPESRNRGKAAPDPIAEFARGIDDLAVAFSARNNLAIECVRQNRLDLASELLPATDDWERVVASRDRKIGDFDDAIQAEWYFRKRNFKLLRLEWYLARVSLAFLESRQTEQGVDFERIGRLVDEYREQAGEKPSLFRLVNLLIELGLDELAIREGITLRSRSRSPFDSNGKLPGSPNDPFVSITRFPSRIVWRDSQPLFELVNRHLAAKDYQAAYDLVVQFEDPLWIGNGLIEILKAEGVEHWPTSGVLPDKIHQYVLRQHREFSAVVKLENRLFDFELARGELDRVAKRLRDFPRDEYAFSQLVPRVAAELAKRGEQTRAFQLIDSVDPDLLDQVAKRTIMELCYDDQFELAIELEERYATDDTMDDFVYPIILCCTRCGKEELVMTELEKMGPDVTRKLYLLHKIAEGAKKTGNRALAESLADLAIEESFPSYLAPMLLAKLDRHQAAIELAESLKGEQAMHFQMLVGQLAGFGATPDQIEFALRNIDKKSRIRNSVQSVARSLVNANRWKAIDEVGEFMEHHPIDLKVLYWSTIAKDLAHRSRKPR